MEISTRNRRALSTILAVFLAVETVSAVAAAAATRTVTHQLPSDAPAGQVLAAEAAVERTGTPAGAASVAISAPAGAPRVVERAEPAAVDHTGATRTTRTTREVAAAAATAKAAAAKAAAAKAATAKAAAKAAEKAAAAKAAAKAAKAAAANKKASKAPGSAGTNNAPSGARKASYSGRNHVWIPALGISRSVRSFPCERSRPPDNYMYRWGCAGSNNVYLMGHASGVMRALHDAYVRGRLSKGMKAWYADSSGKVRQYAVKWWKLTRPTTDAAWAWAPQSVRSMTLQTCVGRNSEYRLIVRLVVVGG
jgi:hypothetical protein